MFLVRFLMVLLLFEPLCMARKVKRKGTYLHVPPPPLPPPPPTGPSPPYEYEHINHDEFPPHHLNQQQLSRYEEDFGHHLHSAASSGNFLIDNGLRSLAQGSANQANSAAASQNAAGKQAAYVAKNTLAHAAVQAAGTAVAVLKGKEVLLRRLEEQSAESHRVMESELVQLQQAKRSAKAAQYSAQQALNHVSVLTAALNNAQSASELAQKSASEAAVELASQIDMVAQAKAKLEQTESHLYSARLDYEETKEAAEKATLSAHEAQINANDAALHANGELNGETAHIDDKSDQNADNEAQKYAANRRSSYGSKHDFSGVSIPCH